MNEIGTIIKALLKHGPKCELFLCELLSNEVFKTVKLILIIQSLNTVTLP